MNTKKFKWNYLAYFLVMLLLFAFSIKGCPYLISLTKKVTEYQGISLGESKDKVKSVLGMPSRVAFPSVKKDLILENKSIIHDVEITSFAKKNEIEADPRKEKAFNEWVFEKKGYSLFIKFNPATDKVNLISCYVFDGAKIDSNDCSVDGIKALDTEEHVIEILGRPSLTTLTGTVKIISYPKLNLYISIEKNAVFNIRVKSE